MSNTPFKMKGFSGFGNSPLKDDATTGEAPHPKHHKKSKKKSDEAFIATAERQKKESMDRLIKKAESEGLSGQAAIDAAQKQYNRNLQAKTYTKQLKQKLWQNHHLK